MSHIKVNQFIMMSTLIPNVLLNKDIPMPALGLGTYRLKSKDEVQLAVKTAIQSGYRLIDSATVYKNEEHIGEIIAELLKDTTLDLKREDIFITSKLAPKDQGFDACYKAVLESLRRLNLDYIDLYLIHWPGTQKLPLNSPQNQINRLASYRALERLKREGRLRAIGVSNYTARHLQELFDECEILPAVHQFELHPLLFSSQREVIELCERHGVCVQAYSSLGEGKLLSLNGSEQPQAIPALSRIASAYNVTQAQVLLRWAIQHRWTVIPKSCNEQRIKENADLFGFILEDQDMAELDFASASVGEQRFCWDPSNVQ